MMRAAIEGRHVSRHLIETYFPPDNVCNVQKLMLPPESHEREDIKKMSSFQKL